MSKVFYNKLVRDRIKEKIEGNGEQCEVRPIADNEEFQQELLKKVAEEASALARSRSREEFLDEYADLMVVLDTLTAQLELSEAEVSLVLKENLERKGGYQERHFLLWSDDSGYESNETPQGIK
ncbi:MAG: nucleoside triphosphate pyrophosphohydrolase [Candidatus Paceibacterota bacterium]